LTLGGKETSLLLVAARGHEQLVELLLRHGAAVNQKDRRGATALMYAAKSGHSAIVLMLLRAGADMSLRTAAQGMTALQAANEHADCVEAFRTHLLEMADAAATERAAAAAVKEEALKARITWLAATRLQATAARFLARRAEKDQIERRAVRLRLQVQAADQNAAELLAEISAGKAQEEEQKKKKKKKKQEKEQRRKQRLDVSPRPELGDSDEQGSWC